MLLIYVYMSVESAPNNFKVYFKKCELQLSIFKNYFTTDVIFIYCLLYSKLWNIEIFLIKTNKMLVSDRNKYMKCLGWSTTIFITYTLFGNENCVLISFKYKLLQFFKGCFDNIDECKTEAHYKSKELLWRYVSYFTQ